MSCCATVEPQGPAEAPGSGAGAACQWGAPMALPLAAAAFPSAQAPLLLCLSPTLFLTGQPQPWQAKADSLLPHQDKGRRRTWGGSCALYFLVFPWNLPLGCLT